MSTVTRVGRSVSPSRVAARGQRRYLVLNGAAMVTIAALALGIIGMLYLIQTSHVAGLGYELSRLQRQGDELALANARLGYDIARFQSLDAVDQAARQQLGMAPMQRYQFLQVQRPAMEDLPTPAPVVEPPEATWHRIWRGLVGIGRASAPTSGPPALSPAKEAP